MHSGKFLDLISDQLISLDMKIIGSVIARAGSKRLPYKNSTAFQGSSASRRAILQQIESKLFPRLYYQRSYSELIARTCMDINELSILKRPESLAEDNIASIPVFQHIVGCFPCDIHLNYNCNFPDCPDKVFKQAITIAKDTGKHYQPFCGLGTINRLPSRLRRPF